MAEFARKADGRRVFTIDFKRETVARIVSGEKTLAELSRELGISPSVLSAESVLVDAALARRSAGVVKLDPAVAGRGRLTKRWGLWLNARLDASPADA